MSSLFDQLGKLAQQATSGKMPNLSGSSTTQNAASTLGSVSDFAGKSLGGVGGLLGAGALGGVLGALMSGKGTGKKLRKVGKGALVVGGSAAAAALAWNMYQRWSQNSANAPTSAPTSTPSSTPSSAPYQGTTATVPPTQSDPMAMLVLEAMVFAARADGHIDDQERGAIHASMEQLFPGTDVAASIDFMLNEPLNPERLARQVQSPAQAKDLYRLSRMVIVPDHSMEQAYLDSLAKALGIAPAEQASLDQEVANLQQQAIAE